MRFITYGPIESERLKETTKQNEQNILYFGRHPLRLQKPRYSEAAGLCEINLVLRPLENGPSRNPASVGLACQRLHDRGAIGMSRTGQRWRSYADIKMWRTVNASGDQARS